MCVPHRIFSFIHVFELEVHLLLHVHAYVSHVVYMCMHMYLMYIWCACIRILCGVHACIRISCGVHVHAYIHVHACISHVVYIHTYACMHIMWCTCTCICISCSLHVHACISHVVYMYMHAYLMCTCAYNMQYSHTSPRDDWIIVENGQMAPSKTSDVDNCQDSCWDSDEGVNTPPMEIEASSRLGRVI